jgi:hypothetical protein
MQGEMIVSLNPEPSGFSHSTVFARIAKPTFELYTHEPLPESAITITNGIAVGGVSNDKGGRPFERGEWEANDA